MEEAAGEAADVADAEDSAGNGHCQHGNGLDKALGPELALDDEVRDYHAQKRRDGGGNEREHEGVTEGLEAVVARKDELEPLAREREELIAPGREERADGNADVHEDDEQGGQRAQHGERRLDASVLDEHPAAGGLARERGGGLGLEIVLLHGEHGERDAQQHHGHGGRAGLIVSAGYLQIYSGGKGVVGAADYHGVCKVGDGLDKRDKKSVAETGKHERQRDAGKDLHATCTHVARGLLKRGVDILQKPLEHHVAHGEEGERLDDDDAPVAVDAVVVYAEEEAGYDAGLAEEHDHRQRQHERRRHDRQHGNDLEKPADEAVHLHVHLNIREKQTDERGKDADDKAHLERVRNGFGKARHIENALEYIEREPIIAHKAIHQQDGQRIENKQSQKCYQHDDGGDHNGVCHQFFSVQRRALASCHSQISSLLIFRKDTRYVNIRLKKRKAAGAAFLAERIKITQS